MILELVMDIQSCCLACLIGQIEKAFQRLRPDTPNEEIVAVQKQAMQNLARLSEIKMPYYGKELYETFNQAFGQDDPYQEVKLQYNRIALDLVPQIHKYLEQSSEQLQTAVAIAILGNTVDFGTPHEIQLEQDLHNFSLDQLVINDFSQFKQDLERAESILIVGDNCGECVFDKVMIEYFTNRYPTKEFIYAVRAGPVINDCTLKDLHGTGFAEICTVIESSASPGVILPEATSAFQQTFRTADLVISKGQGNFEALDDIPPPNGSLYFFLKAKCDHVAGIFGVPKGSLILKKQNLES